MKFFLTASDTFEVLGITFYGMNPKTANIFTQSWIFLILVKDTSDLLCIGKT